MQIPFAEHSERIQQHIEGAYGIRVITRDVEDPLVGDLDGEEIHIDLAVTPEQRLFLLAHLFGHTVQWNAHPSALALGRPRRPPVAPAAIPGLLEYERQAASYALTMVHEVGIWGIDQWLSDYTACDTAYLEHYYLTGEKKSFESCWRDGAPVIEPVPIPPFRTMKRVRRSEGVVI
jgi:hypothetical protein